MLLEYEARPEWGQIWATEPDNRFIAPNQRFDASALEASDDPSSDVRRRLYLDSRAALAAGTFRPDASDMMSREIGGDDGSTIHHGKARSTPGCSTGSTA